MTEAPKQIWLDWPNANRGEPVFDEPPEHHGQAAQTKYVRADIAQEAALQALASDGQAQEALDKLRAVEAERDALRGHLTKAVKMLGALVAESGREVEWGHEDAFRMGEWFEKDDLAAIAAARAALEGRND